MNKDIVATLKITVNGDDTCSINCKYLMLLDGTSVMNNRQLAVKCGLFQKDLELNWLKIMPDKLVEVMANRCEICERVFKCCSEVDNERA